MNFIEVCRSGKRFKRKEWKTNSQFIDFKHLVVDGVGYLPVREDFLADDWVVIDCEYCNDTKMITSFTQLDGSGFKNVEEHPCPKCSPKPKVFKTVKMFAPMIKDEYGSFQFFLSTGYKRSKEEWKYYEKYEAWSIIDVEVEVKE